MPRAVLAGPRAVGPSAPHRCRRPRRGAGDSPAGRCTRGGGLPPWPSRRSRRWWSPGRWSAARRRGRTQAAQARARSSRLTRSSWRTWPHRKLRRKVPNVDGALTTQPSTRPVLPERSASASSMQSPPASAEATRVINLSPVLARPGALTQVHVLVHQVFASAPGAAPRWRAAAARHWPPGGDRRRLFGCRRGLKWQHLKGAPFPGSVLRAKTIIQDSEEHLLTLSAHLSYPILRWIQVIDIAPGVELYIANPYSPGDLQCE